MEDSARTVATAVNVRFNMKDSLLSATNHKNNANCKEAPDNAPAFYLYLRGNYLKANVTE